jgi:probable HAF family extracellular repeat protein
MKSSYVKCLVTAGWTAFTILPLLARAQLIDLGEAYGYALNNAGQVVLSTGIYSNGTVAPLPALPGQTTPAMGVAINASGQVAGNALAQVTVGSFDQSPETQSGNVPIAYVDGTLTNISLAFSADSTAGYVEPGYATGINANNQIVGYYTALDPRSIDPAPTIGFIYTNGAITELSACCAPYEIPINMPQAINESGSVAGIFTVNDPNTANPGNTRFDAYVYSAGNETDLGQGAAYAINAAGQVTGDLDVIALGGPNGYTIVNSYAFLYSNGTTTNLGALSSGGSSTGFAINATGQVVGGSTAANSGGHAFFYNGVMTDLNSLISATDPLKPYVTLTNAVGINDSLLILANGTDSRTNTSHAYLFQASFIQIAPMALNFAMEAVGEASLAQSVTVTNAGTAAIPIGTAYVNGDFSLRLNICGTSLAPGAQCRLAVVFAPKVGGALTGALTIPSAGANYQVALSGAAPITAKISASGSTATVGQPITLTWTVSPGSTCTAASSSTNAKWTASNPPFTGTVPVSGNQTLTETVNGTVTYTLNCTAPGVTAVSVSVSVVWSWPPVTTTISASPTTIIAGKSTTLAWTSSNATSCTATGGGPDDSWAGTKATSGSQTITEPFALEVSSVVLTFAITCNSTTSGLSAAASVNVTEDQAPGGPSGSGVTATLSASPTTITVGQSTALRWKSSNASSCTATGGGADDNWAGPRATSGSQTVTESATLTTSSVELTFGITCSSSSTGLSGKASVSVTEDQSPGGSGGGGVTATISASPTTITVGQSTTLTWKSSNATSCAATGGGADDGWAGTKATNGSLSVIEAAALDTASIVLSFGITCDSSIAGQSGKASVNVTENQAAATSGGTTPASSGGGGGALNWLSLAFLAGIFALRHVYPQQRA